MASSLQINTQLTDTGYTVTASLAAGSILPPDIFTYVNTGTTTLGDYFGVVAILDLPRLQVWTGAAIPVFGNGYVRYSQAVIHVPITVDVNSVITLLITSVQNLSTAFKAAQTTSRIVQIT